MHDRFRGPLESLEYLLAFPTLKPKRNPSKEGNIEVFTKKEGSADSEIILDLGSSEKSSEEGINDYQKLQFRIVRMALILTACSVLILSFCVDIQAAISLLIGALSGIFYLRLLARGIGKLGKTSMSVGKVQLLIPVLLFFLVARFPQIELWPTLLGFILYKPALIVQFLLED